MDSFKDKVTEFWHRHKKTILILLLVIAAGWLLGQLAVPVLVKEIFLGGHIG